MLQTVALRWALLAKKNWSLARRLREERYLAFPRATRSNLVFIYYPHCIPESQLYPFHRYRKDLADELGLRSAHVSTKNLERLERSAKRPLENVQIVCLQTWFDLPRSDMRELVERVKRLYPNARLAYYDWFATTDLRMADIAGPLVDVYVKKNRFANYRDYERSHAGDTNLTDYYGRLYDIAEPEKRYAIPRGFEKKLLTGDSFITGPIMEPLFSLGSPVLDAERPIDLHARLGGSGEDWYGRMRDDARQRVVDLGLDRAVWDGTLPFGEYLGEIVSSKLTFSPFGYGEICWRDFEAMALGSLLIKPDVSHLEDQPRLFIPHETYVPIAWDFSDLEDAVRRYLSDERERLRIAGNAFEAGRRYFRDHGFMAHARELRNAAGIGRPSPARRAEEVHGLASAARRQAGEWSSAP